MKGSRRRGGEIGREGSSATVPVVMPGDPGDAGRPVR